MEEGLLSLKWNNHKSTFFQVLSGLREKHTYTDVTLACDGQVYPAHKFVLSTCSEYFSEIFTSTSGTSIVIVLKDVRRQDLEYLMDYMYLGQVDVAQSELPSLIKTAECLRIKGLAIPDDEPHKTQRRGADEREGSPPPSKKKRYLQEDDRHPASSTSTTNNNNNTTSTSSSSSSTSASGRIQMEVLPPPSDLSSLVHLRQPPHSQQPLQAPPPPPPTSQGSSKSHSSQSLSLNLTTQASRTPQGGSSGPHVHTPTSTSAPSSHRPHSSPSHTTPVPVIKEEAADPPETPEGYLNESFEENETKPDVSDPRHLDPDGAVPGPSGLQGSDNWDGDGEMGGYGGSDSYPEGSLEEHGESEVQGDSWHNVHQLVGPHLQHHSDQQEHQGLGTRGTPPHFSYKRAISSNPQREGILGGTDQPESLEAGDSASQSAAFLMESVENLALSGSRSSGESSLYKTSQHSEDDAEIVFMSTSLHETMSSSQDLQVTPGTQLYSEGSSLTYCVPHSSLTRQASGSLSEKPMSDPQHLKAGECGGTNRYICQWCGRNFDRVSNLKRHLLLHSGIKPFKCLYCNYRATQKANVVQHLASRHKNEMRALLQNNISVNDILVPSGPSKR
ncbi:hypothetical protein O3P69_006001 [Scylla paramamosain]|uniref:Broad-complex core protein n=1 Tax=Scylla paramamosain TaxID=85552 RepID=A0AAW0U545_SCYPA